MSTPVPGFKYEVPELLNRIKSESEDILALAVYYSIEFAELKEARQHVHKERLGLYLAAAKAPFDLSTIDELINVERIPATDNEQLLVNLDKVLRLLESKRGSRVDVPLMQEVHSMLLNKMPSSHTAGKFRTSEVRDLFSAMGGDGLPNEKELEQYLTLTVQLANDRSMPALIRCWLFYYSIIVLQPFGKMNDMVAALCTEHILRQQDDDIFGLVDIEKHVFNDKDFDVLLAELTKAKYYKDRLEEDLTPLIERGLKGYMNALYDVKRAVTEQIKLEFNYDVLSPRQKNNFNFWLETFFFKQRHKLGNLTERQREMLELLLKNGSMQNKDFVPIYKLDRKTIQRDFNALMEQRLVTSKGAGRSLQYCLDMKVSLS